MSMDGQLKHGDASKDIWPSGRPKTFYINKMLEYAASANAHFLDVSAAQDELRDLIARIAALEAQLCEARSHCRRSYPGFSHRNNVCGRPEMGTK